MQAQEPIFYDQTGRRWRRLRRGALVTGIVTTLVLVVAAIAVLIPPLLPSLPLKQTAADSLGRTARSARPQPRRIVSARAERERLLSRQKLFAELQKHPAPPSRRYSQMSITRPRIRYDSALAARSPHDPIVVGFYVNWDDNSLVSLRQRIDSLDWVVAEWVLLGRGADSVPFSYQVDRRVLALAARGEHHPQVLALITNFTGEDFDPRAVAKLIDHPRIRKKAIADLVAMLEQYNLAGVTIDFEQIPPAMHPRILSFLRELKAALAPSGRLLTQALPVDDPTWPIAEYARINDRVFAMLYDEHDASDEPGPIASNAWFVRSLDQVLRSLPPEKVIAAVGQYGYHWVDTTETAEQLDFQEMIQLARDAEVHPALDSITGNPTFSWTDSTDVRHIVWYLDAVTAFNEVRLALARGVAGVGVWRLGSEDPSIWSVLGRGGLAPRAAPLDTIRNSYDVEFVGSGEILRMVAEPTFGRRSLVIDPATGLVTHEQVLDYPSTYVIRRYGRRDKQIALTFDDGPDPVFTGMILDTLRSRGVHATFFIIGQNAEVHPEILKRTFREGHEIGNHTFTHPNLALVGKSVTRVELNATERLIEAVLDRRTALLRPPYFGDAEPTTADELVPISIAQGLGYITVGLHIDPDDWAEPGVDSIIARTLNQLYRGNIVLLHDSGGDRRQTVAALGPLIDSIKARGYQLVTVSELAHIRPEVAMAPLPPGSRLERFVELTSFSLVGSGELVLRAVFLLAMVLGGARLLFILSLAMVQRFRSHHAPATDFHPTVSVIVPAYREELVIIRTVESLLAQGYEGMEIIVVDDGSPDRTYEVTRHAFEGRSDVRVFRKENGGKSSALNFGLAYVRGDIVVALDADTLFPPGTIAALVAPLVDPRVGAVAGNAKVGNRINLVTRWQAIEYVTSQNLDRRAFALLNCITVVPGAIGAWRRQLVREAGGFSDQTLAEDQDLTMTLLRQGWHIAYADRAVALTEAPDTLKALAKQRFRWCFGTLQCAWKHRGVLLRPRYGTMGLIAMPNIWLFQLLLPSISPAADLLFLWSLVTVWLNKVQHGAEYAMQTLEQVLFFYSVFLLVDWLTALIALWMEEGEDRALSWLVLLQRFVYRQVMYWVVIRALVAALRGRVIGWGKLERKATVAMGSTNSD
ncbi:MAG TPA: glycosyltransferase [Gemmatimonadales bacterium]|nr:glycosyltransferase [Gemmatimonadales bacterium]